MKESIRSLKKQIKFLERSLEFERRGNETAVEGLRNSIRGERVVNERLTREKFELERRIRRGEDQRRAVLLILERDTEPTGVVNNTAQVMRAL